MKSLLAAALLALSLPLFSHESRVSFSTQGNERIVRSNGIPGHKTGVFPNAQNPNSVGEQKYEFHMTLRPGFSGHVTQAGNWIWGVALNGVVFDPATAEFWHGDRRSGWNYEAKGGHKDFGLDHYNAHVQPDGAYHYHGIPKPLLKGKEGMALVGYAADGFPVYGPRGYKDPDDPQSPLITLRPGWRLKSGSRPGGSEGPGRKYDGEFSADYEYVESLGDLDECNGRKGVTPEYPKGTYYYVLSESFPYVPRCWKGEPDESFRKNPPTAPLRKGKVAPPRGPRKPVDPGEPF